MPYSPAIAVPDRSLVHRLVVHRRDAAVVAATTAAWTIVTWAAFIGQGKQPWLTRPWGRWDSGNYVRIARNGYSLHPCVDVPNRFPTDWCGTTGWHPGYPYAIRIVNRLGVPMATAGRLLALAAMVATFTLLWVCFLKARPRAQGLTAMALVAVFPGSVYYGAIFPISFVTLSMVACLVALDRGRWLLAGMFGMLGALSYPTGAVLAVVAVVPLVTPTIGPWRIRLRAAVSVAGPILGAYLLVLANFQRAVGRWDAWFMIQVGYRYHRAWPWESLVHRLQQLDGHVGPRWPAAQTALVIVMMAVVGWVTARQWTHLRLVERSAAVLVGALWLLPLTVGGDLSLHRAESLLLPAVILLARSPARLVGGLAAAAAPVAYSIAGLYTAALII